MNLPTRAFSEAFAEVRANPHVSAMHSPAVVLFASGDVVSIVILMKHWVQEVLLWSISGIGME